MYDGVLDQFSNYQPEGGRYMRKGDEQMITLQKAFDENPNWTYPFKMKIASQTGMTLSQVAKWNWDQRKKLGLSTEHDRKKKI